MNMLYRSPVSKSKINITSGKLLHNYGKSPFLMGQSTISMAIFNSKLLPEGKSPSCCYQSSCWLVESVNFPPIPHGKFHRWIPIYRRSDRWSPSVVSSEIGTSAVFWFPDFMIFVIVRGGSKHQTCVFCYVSLMIVNDCLLVYVFKNWNEDILAG
jgi:hypothetical protein